jgi:hypothetical protein
VTLLAGSCSIAPGGAVTGTGLAKALADAMMAPPAPGADSNKMLEQWANLTAAAIVNYLTANASITVTIKPSDVGLQQAPTPGGPVPTLGPLLPVPLTGTVT